MSDEAEKITSLGSTVFKQDKLIQDLNERCHQFDIELTKVLSALKNINSSYSRLDVQLKETTKEIYKRFDSFDNELKGSLEKRDKKIVDLRIDAAKVNTRLVIYAGLVFFVISTITQIVIRMVT